jgi:hypothetical protein
MILMQLLSTFPGLVYILCAATSLMCAILLGRGYWRSRAKLLFWSSLCFLGMTIENVLLYVDRIVVPDIGLDPLRKIPGLVALMLLVFGLVFGDE